MKDKRNSREEKRGKIKCVRKLTVESKKEFRRKKVEINDKIGEKKVNAKKKGKVENSCRRQERKWKLRGNECRNENETDVRGKVNDWEKVKSRAPVNVKGEVKVGWKMKVNKEDKVETKIQSGRKKQNRWKTMHFIESESRKPKVKVGR